MAQLAKQILRFCLKRILFMGISEKKSTEDARKMRHFSSLFIQNSHFLGVLGVLFFCLVGSSCQRNSCLLEPQMLYCPPPWHFDYLPCTFPPLTPQERAQDWGKELFVGKAFAKEMDFYRAITSYKKAFFLLPKKAQERRMEIEYDIFLAYYAAGKYQEAVNAFEGSQLYQACDTFPAYKELLIALYDAYMKTDQTERACFILTQLDAVDEEAADKLTLGTAIVNADFNAIAETAPCTTAYEPVSDFISCYCQGAKSVKKAQVLNALLPGAGYYYVGQKQSAVTSFLINALFIAAAYQLFDRGYIPAGIIVSSLEMGWYFGGINGAGLEAKQYNQCLYERLGRETMEQERLFPILMIQKGF